MTTTTAKPRRSGQLTEHFWYGVAAVMCLYFLYLLRGLQRDRAFDLSHQERFAVVESQVDKLRKALAEDPAILSVDEIRSTVDTVEQYYVLQNSTMQQLRAALTSLALGRRSVVTSGESASSKSRQRSLSMMDLQSQCYKLEKSYWSFSFCVGNSVRQLHAGDATYSLGQFRREVEVTVDFGLPNSVKLVQEFRDGDPCTEGVRRETDVHISCGSSNAGEILDVTEPSLCRYLVRFAAPLSARVCM